MDLTSFFKRLFGALVLAILLLPIQLGELNPWHVFFSKAGIIYLASTLLFWEFENEL